MIFQHTHEMVLTGRKTQTRRIKKKGEHFEDGRVFTFDICSFKAVDGAGQVGLFNGHKERTRWEVGKTYAVQPARGQPAIGRIRITGIREQDVREISDADVRAEGFASKANFLETWTQMHDRLAHVRLLEYQRLGLPHVWENYLQNRPAERYQAWVLEFQLVR